MADEEGTDSGAEAAPPKSKKKLFIIIGVVLLVVIGAVAFLFLGKSPEKEEKHEEAVVHFEQFELGMFTVNLSESSSFLRVKLVVEYDPTKLFGGGGMEGEAHAGEVYVGSAGAGGEEGKSGSGWPGVFGQREPMIRDAVIRVLSAKTAAQVLKPEGKEEIVEELIDGINEATGLDDPPVVNVYFLEFLIQ